MLTIVNQATTSNIIFSPHYYSYRQQILREICKAEPTLPILIISGTTCETVRQRDSQVVSYNPAGKDLSKQNGDILTTRDIWNMAYQHMIYR